MALVASLVAALAAVLLAASALAKLAAAGQWGHAARSIAPHAWRPLAVAVPAGELAIALVVLARPAAGLAAAALLLAAFAVGAFVLRPRLEGTSCGCFGALAPSRFGRTLIWRNALAALAAGLAAVAASRVEATPTAPGALAGAGVIAVLALAIARWRSRPRLGPRVGSALDVPRATTGRPLLTVVLAPGCPPCEALAPTLRRLAGERQDVDVVAVVADAPEAAASRLAAVLDGIATVRDDGLIDAWRVPGTPYAIAVGADGTVRAAGVAEQDGLAGFADLAAARVEQGPSSSRRELLAWTGRAAVAGGVALGMSGALPALAGAATRAVRVRALRDIPGIFYDRHSRNRIRGDCNAFADRLEQKGVYSWDGTAKPNAVGYTWGDGIEDGQQPHAGVCRRRERITRIWRGHCPCPSRMKNYDSESLCAAECPSGLACFGYQCVTDYRRVCIDVNLDVCVRVPTIVISVAEWTPTGRGVGAACRRYAANLTTAVRRHELHHALDVKKAVAQTNDQFKNRNLHACGQDEAEARALINEQVKQLLQDARDALKDADSELSDTFHGTPEGAHAVLNCPASHCP